MDGSKTQLDAASAQLCPPLKTNRAGAVGQLIICEGCCCGRTDRGYSAVPKERLKTQWKARKLNRAIQLTISGCLGPCDLANVVWLIGSAGETIWLGQIAESTQYDELVEWATRCQVAQAFLPVPDCLTPHHFSRFDA